MKRTRTVLTILVLLILVAAQMFAGEKIHTDIPIEVTEIRNLGLSDSDDTKSIIEIHWRVNNSLHPETDSFDLWLETLYADGAVVVFDAQADGSTRSTRIEIPTLHITRGRQAAFIKQLKALVITTSPSQKISQG